MLEFASVKLMVPEVRVNEPLAAIVRLLAIVISPPVAEPLMVTVPAPVEPVAVNVLNVALHPEASVKAPPLSLTTSTVGLNVPVQVRVEPLLEFASVKLMVPERLSDPLTAIVKLPAMVILVPVAEPLIVIAPAPREYVVVSVPKVALQPEASVKAPPASLTTVKVPPIVPVHVRVESSVLLESSKVTVAPVIVNVPPEEVKLRSIVQVPVVAVWVPPETVKEPSFMSKKEVASPPTKVPVDWAKLEEPTVMVVPLA